MSDAMKIITAILLMLSGFMAYNLYFGSKGVEKGYRAAGSKADWALS